MSFQPDAETWCRELPFTKKMTGWAPASLIDFENGPYSLDLILFPIQIFQIDQLKIKKL